jgi:hypothetical protein
LKSAGSESTWRNPFATKMQRVLDAGWHPDIYGTAANVPESSRKATR